jgi:hypothetical protein
MSVTSNRRVKSGVRHQPLPDRGGKFVEGWNYHNVLEFALARGMGDGSSGSS